MPILLRALSGLARSGPSPRPGSLEARRQELNQNQDGDEKAKGGITVCNEIITYLTPKNYRRGRNDYSINSKTYHLITIL